MARKRASTSKPKTTGRTRRKTTVEDYRHDEAKRKNNPPAKIAAEGTVPAVPKAQYVYNPHLPPILRFDKTGEADEWETRLSAAAQARATELLTAARQRPLTADEAAEIDKLLQTAGHARVPADPWLEWADKREQHERGWFDVDPVALHIHERVSTQAILKVAARQDVQRSLFADPQHAD